MSGWLKNMFGFGPIPEENNDSLSDDGFTSDDGSTIPVKNRYDFKEVLGFGTFYQVRLCQSKAAPEKQVVIKTIDRKKLTSDEEQLNNEISKLAYLNHPNIVQLLEFCMQDAIEVHLVMERITGGKLIDAIVEKESYTERDAVRVIEQMLNAVDFMHAHNVIHSILKPENILCYHPGDFSRIIIKNFGWSQILQEHECNEVLHSNPRYLAPEIILGQPMLRKEVDMWSIGVISYVLLCGYPPFKDDNEDHLLKKITRGDYRFDTPYWDDISFAAQDFIMNLLCVDTIERSTCQGALSHAWIAEDRARNENIHCFIAEHLRKHFVKSRWEWEPPMDAKITFSVMKKPASCFTFDEEDYNGEILAAASVGYESPTSPPVQ